MTGLPGTRTWATGPPTFRECRIPVFSSTAVRYAPTGSLASGISIVAARVTLRVRGADGGDGGAPGSSFSTVTSGRFSTTSVTEEMSAQYAPGGRLHRDPTLHRTTSREPGFPPASGSL